MIKNSDSAYSMDNELTLDQLDGVAGGSLGTLISNAITIGGAVYTAGGWLKEQFEKHADKRGDSFEHWG